VIGKRTLLWLTAVAVVVPIALAVVLLLGRLLARLGDTTGARVLDLLALVLAVAWAIELICLLLATALHVLAAPDDRSEEP
jgi:hypothetical protein